MCTGCSRTLVLAKSPKEWAWTIVGVACAVLALAVLGLLWYVLRALR
jgi:hypothetical protein